jgi:hypothetical protein
MKNNLKKGVFMSTVSTTRIGVCEDCKNYVAIEKDLEKKILPIKGSIYNRIAYSCKNKKVCTAVAQAKIREIVESSLKMLRDVQTAYALTLLRQCMQTEIRKS